MELLDRLRLEVPVAQAGMGGGLSDGRLAAAVAAAGGLGTIGLLPPVALSAAVERVRDEAPGRAVGVNLLMPFLRRHHIETCVAREVNFVVIAFGEDEAVVRTLREAGIFVFAMVGTQDQARRAVTYGVDGLIAQGREAGGHLVGTVATLEFLPLALRIAGGRPVLAAGGIANGTDTMAALDAGASGVVAGTRFLLTHESGAHREYQRRVLEARQTLETNLFGLAWPLRHRVVPNAATERWGSADGTARRLPELVNARSGALARVVPERGQRRVPRLQRSRLPLFSPAAPLAGMPDATVDRAALYAGESALRMSEVVSAAEAVADLAGCPTHRKTSL